MPLWGFLICIMLAFFWAFAPIMLDKGRTVSGCTLNEVNPVRSIVFFISILFIVIVLNHGHVVPMCSFKAWIYLFIAVSTGYIIGDMLCVAAIREVGVSIAIPLANSYTVLVPFFSLILLHEHITYKLMIGVVTVVIGVIAINVKHRDTPREPLTRKSIPRLFRGLFLGLSAAFFWALSAPFIKMAIVNSNLSCWDFALNKSIAFLVVSMILRLFQVQSSSVRTVALRCLGMKTWLFFGGSAFIGLTLGSIFQTICFRAMPVAIVSAITASSPFITALYGHFILGEDMNLFQWIGVVLIISGSIVIAV